MKPQGIENIIKAVHGIGSVCEDIRYTCEYATMTESIILDGLIKSAHELRARLEHFQSAITDVELDKPVSIAR